jgi:hypothetical protein
MQHATSDSERASLNDMRKAWRRTNVADMPGYPTRKLLLGGPETRTKADMVAYGMELVGAGLGWQQALHGRRLGPPKLPLSSAVSLQDAWVVQPDRGAVPCSAVQCSAGSWTAFRLRDGVGLEMQV